MSRKGVDMMTVVEAAAYLRISRDLAYDLIKRNELPHVRLGRIIRVPKHGLDQWISRESGLPLTPQVEVTSLERRQEH